MLIAPFHNSPALRSLAQRGFLRLAVVFAILATMLLLSVASASAETRTLRMYFTHTKESAKITFKRNGRYVKSGLRKANRFLRDWRRKEPTRMDPALLDLVWEVYKKSGSRKPIHVISAYRSPRTNNMLRRRGRKVAKTSMHMKGRALDFFMPDVSVKKLRALGLKAHRGGVGYYRGSFVHLDTGRVRHWPRMSRRQLARVFPRGKTIHVPSNGRPLKGYKVAMANLKRGRNANGSKRGTTIKGGTTLLARLFQGGGRATDDDGDAVEAATPKPKPKRETKKEPEAVAVAKAEEPKLKRKRGSDPFASEAVAVGEETAPELVAALVPSRLAVPVRRPGAAVPEEPAVQVQATELALASPSATTGILRPTVEVSTPTSSPAAIFARAQVPQQTAELKERVALALTRQRSSTVAQRAAEALVVRRPQAAIRTALLETAKQQSGNNQLAARLGPKPSALGGTLPSEPLDAPAATKLPAMVEVPLPTAAKPARLDDAVVLAALKRREGLTSAKLTTLSERSAAKASASVPIPRPIESVDTETASIDASAPVVAKMKSELALGNLDGRSVKVWAVAASTRIGPIAKLQAPAYKKSLARQAPVTVVGDGFTSKRPIIRSDRFTGRALTRIAFARLASL